MLMRCVGNFVKTGRVSVSALSPVRGFRAKRVWSRSNLKHVSKSSFRQVNMETGRSYLLEEKFKRWFSITKRNSKNK